MHVLTQVEQGRDLGFEASMTKLIWSEPFQDLWEVFDDVLGEDATLAEAAGVDLGPLHGAGHVVPLGDHLGRVLAGAAQRHRRARARPAPR